MENEKLAYTIKQTSNVLPIGPTKIYELIREGKLKTFKVGRRTLVTAESLRALVNQAA